MNKASYNQLQDFKLNLYHKLIDTKNIYIKQSVVLRDRRVPYRMTIGRSFVT